MGRTHLLPLGHDTGVQNKSCPNSPSLLPKYTSRLQNCPVFLFTLHMNFWFVLVLLRQGFPSAAPAVMELAIKPRLAMRFCIHLLSAGIALWITQRPSFVPVMCCTLRSGSKHLPGELRAVQVPPGSFPSGRLLRRVWGGSWAHRLSDGKELSLE